MSNNKAKEIANGWKNLLRSRFGLTTEEEEILFEKRYQICKACEYGQGNYCEKCGCLLKAKTKSIISECPEKLW